MIRALAHARVSERQIRDFGPRDQSVGAPPTFCTSDKSECGRLRAGSLEQFRGIPVASYGTKALPQDT